VKSPYERLGKWVFRRTKSSGGLKQLKEAGLVDYESCPGKSPPH
jgi:hypothetical protein